MNVRIDSNRAEDFRERLSLLTTNGLQAIVIVMVILVLFLEYRLAFWVMMGMTMVAASSVGFIIRNPLGAGRAERCPRLALAGGVGDRHKSRGNCFFL